MLNSDLPQILYRIFHWNLKIFAKRRLCLALKCTNRYNVIRRNWVWSLKTKKINFQSNKYISSFCFYLYPWIGGYRPRCGGTWWRFGWRTSTAGMRSMRAPALPPHARLARNKLSRMGEVTRERQVRRRGEGGPEAWGEGWPLSWVGLHQSVVPLRRSLLHLTQDLLQTPEPRNKCGSTTMKTTSHAMLNF